MTEPKRLTHLDDRRVHDGVRLVDYFACGCIDDRTHLDNGTIQVNHGGYNCRQHSGAE